MYSYIHIFFSIYLLLFIRLLEITLFLLILPIGNTLRNNVIHININCSSLSL